MARKIVKWFILEVLFSMILISPVMAEQTAEIGFKTSMQTTDTAQWQIIGEKDFTAQYASPLCLAVHNGIPYLAYCDEANSGKATVMKYEGPNWVPVGKAGFSTGRIYALTFTFVNDMPYIVYKDGDHSDQVVVMKYDGSNWVTVGTPSILGELTAQIGFTIVDGIIYAPFLDAGYSVKVKKFNGSTWVLVGNPISPNDVNNLSLSISNGTPYLSYMDGYTLKIFKYDGSDWVSTFKDHLFGTRNYSLIISNGIPYVAYEDKANSSKATVLKYDGSDWVAVGSPGLSSGGIANPVLVMADNNLYLAYSQGNENPKVMKYDGNNWAAVGSSVFSTGELYAFSWSINNGVPYLAYADWSTYSKATVIKYDVQTDKTNLINAINSAQILLNATPVGSAVGNVLQSAHDTFANVITSAIAVRDYLNSTQADIDAQVQALDMATVTFNGAVITSGNPPVASTADFKPAIASSYHYNLGVTTEGKVLAWGDNEYGQLGDGTTTNHSAPVTVTGLSNIISVDGGGSETACDSIALKTDGTVWAWGSNEYGQLGNDSDTDHLTPVQVSGLSDIIAIAAGDYHNLALKNDGTVWAWGRNTNGQLGNGKIVNCGIPVQVSGLSNITAIAAGGTHSLALDSAGNVWAWGNNNCGQLGDDSTDNRKIPVQVADLSDVTAISAGNLFSLALLSDGTVWAWGLATSRQLGDVYLESEFHKPIQVPNLTRIKAIAAGWLHGLALKKDGTFWAWGSANSLYHRQPFQVNGLTGITAIAAGCSSLALGDLEKENSVWDLDSATDTLVRSQVQLVTTSSDLTNISLSPCPQGYSFTGNVYSYSGLTVSNDVSGISVTSTGTGVITVNGTVVASGTSSNLISLAAGQETTLVITTTKSGMSPKTYIIKVTRQTAAATVTVNVTPSDVTMNVGDTKQITVTTQPSDAQITYTPSDTSVVSVDSRGLITAVGKGTATITVKATKAGYTSGTASVKVTVNQSNTVTIAKIQQTSPISVANGTARATLNLPATITVTLSNGSQASCTVSWDNGSPSYDPCPAAATSYTFTGTLTCPTGVSNPNNLKATVGVNVAGAGGSSSDTWTDWTAKQKSSSESVTITFNREVDSNSVNNTNIYVATDETGSNKVSGISVAPVNGNAKQVKVDPPAGGWQTGGTYYLFISKQVKSSAVSGGQALASGIRMPFVARIIFY